VLLWRVLRFIFCYAECRYAECRCAESRSAMLAVTLMIVILLIFGLLSVAQLDGECFEVLLKQNLTHTTRFC
jgi:hypothetical protein